MLRFYFEQFIINFVNSKSELQQWIDFNIRDFFYYLKTYIYYDVNDPKGIQGNLNNLSFEQKKSISEKANWAYEKAKEAISAETSEKNQEKAINKWREIFGKKFPTYG